MADNGNTAKEKKPGFFQGVKREWRKMIPVVSSGFGVGTGLIAILAVGIVFLSKAVSTVSY